MTIRSTALALVAVLIGAGWALADCAPYISSGAGDNPATGYLLGETLVTEETSFGVAGPAHASRRVSAQYSVGHYRMSDGRTINVDCRTYSQV